MKWIKRLLITLGVAIILCYIIGFILNCFITNDFVLKFDLYLLFSITTLKYFGLLFFISLLIILFYYHDNYWVINGKNIIKAKNGDERIKSNLEQSKFQSEKEVNYNFQKIDYSNLSKKDVVGIPIKVVEKRKRLSVNFAPNAHTLIIGTTGSGKTTTYINPTIQILSKSHAKPSMLISDPKGELYALHAKSLLAKGYDVKVLDLRNPFNSTKWNPLEKPFLLYQRMLHLQDEVSFCELTKTYVFDNVEYNNIESLNSALQVKKQKLYDQVYEDIHDIVTVLCPITNKNEPIWERGAKNFVLAIALAMLEDSENPELGMTVDKFNFYNLTKIATNTENDCEELIKYFQGRNVLSKAASLSKQVLDSADKTRGSYLSTTFDKLNLFADLSVCSLTSSNEITFADMADKPIALFLQIPDEKETRHTLAAMVMLQAYKELVSKANDFKDHSLPRSVYFLMDEFGNLPAVHKLEQMITVGRSRNIWLCLVLQSYAQLAKVYDEKTAEIIRSNCNIQVFIGTTDPKTIEEFSKRCGNYTVVTRNVGYNTAKQDDINSNASIKERPLIYPSELAQLNKPGDTGNAIVSVFGYMPIKSKFTPSYDCTAYTLEQTTQKLEAGRFFDEAKVFYDMKKRNAIIVPRSRSHRSSYDSKMSITQQTENVKERIKELIERSINEELLSTDEKIYLLSLIDQNGFSKAKEIIAEVSKKALELNLDYTVNSLDDLTKRLSWIQYNYFGNATTPNT